MDVESEERVKKEEGEWEVRGWGCGKAEGRAPAEGEGGGNVDAEEGYRSSQSAC